MIYTARKPGVVLILDQADAITYAEALAYAQALLGQRLQEAKTESFKAELTKTIAALSSLKMALRDD